MNPAAGTSSTSTGLQLRSASTRMPHGHESDVTRGCSRWQGEASDYLGTWSKDQFRSQGSSLLQVGSMLFHAECALAKSGRRLQFLQHRRSAAQYTEAGSGAIPEKVYILNHDVCAFMLAQLGTCVIGKHLVFPESPSMKQKPVTSALSGRLLVQ
eukprot:1156994-Pelagomonas_calceolata.AAC.8